MSVRLLATAGITLSLFLMLAPGAGARQGTVTIDEPGVYRFADLGWSGDIVLTNDSPRATVQFTLPDDARQDAPDWYGVYIEFTWEGRPGPGGVAFLEANWNDRGVVQVQVERPPVSTFPAMEVSTVDLVNGYRLVNEVSPRITASSTNYATYGAIKGGTNTLEVRLDPSFAGGSEFRVTISKRSAIFRDPLGPTKFEVEGEASLDGSNIEARLKGRNTGLPVSPVRLALAIYSLGSPPQHLSWPLEIDPGRNRFEAEVSAQLANPQPVEVRAWMEWNGGRSFPVTIWPRRDGGSALDWVPYAPWTTVVAFVVAWIAVPAAWRRLRAATAS
ncbi:MAG: hypothetical protein Kow0010_27410 [Dehalococcoidia bacterium]